MSSAQCSKAIVVVKRNTSKGIISAKCVLYMAKLEHKNANARA